MPSSRNPLHAGLNPPPEEHDAAGRQARGCGVGALTIGSCAAGHRESGQVRKEAALSGLSRVL